MLRCDFEQYTCSESKMNGNKLKIQNKARQRVGGRMAKRGGRAAIEERARCKRLGGEVTIV